jgi:DNA glycosylase AlkZ-like
MARTGTVSISWPQALAWRLRRQFLDPRGNHPVEGVVRRLGAVKAEPQEGAELAIRVRQTESEPDEVTRALGDGRLIKTFAYRGATHLLTPEGGSVVLALRASSRMWELPSWESYYGLKPSDWPALLDAAREALSGEPLTFDEFGAAITAAPRFRHLAVAFGERNWTLIKPLAWHGVLCFGPGKGRATLQALERNPLWTGLLDVDDAGAAAVESYLRAYGPATIDHLRYWLGQGLGAGGRGIKSWLARLGDRVMEVDVAGDAALLMSDDVDALAASQASRKILLLPAFDQWVFGPGTTDTNVVPPAKRNLVSRGANVVIDGGRVSGTWSLAGDLLNVTWFSERGAPRTQEIRDEATRLAGILARPLKTRIE